MNQFLDFVEIKNFKSIKSLKLNAKRVNVFIGKPNVGKSNILEAISLLGAEYCIDKAKFFSEFIRYEEISNLFYDDDLLNTIEINSNKAKAVLRFNANNYDVGTFIVGDENSVNELIDKLKSNELLDADYNNNVLLQYNIKKINKTASSYYPLKVDILSNGVVGNPNQFPLQVHSVNPVKKYNFKQGVDISNKFPLFLIPPNGNNLFAIVDHNKELRKEIVEIFEEYNLQFVASKKDSKFEIQKTNDGYVNKYHYSSIADTFQRLIFYYAAIDSNTNSVLLLEEPEVHSFPPYTKELSDRIIDSSENQFFITTHSPYMLQNLVQSLDSNQLNVFVTYFDEYQTKIKCLTNEELKMVSDFGVDLFYNLHQFTPNG